MDHRGETMSAEACMIISTKSNLHNLFNATKNGVINGNKK